MVETCTRYADKKYIHPIIQWTEAEVWEYIKMFNIPYCKLYDEGFKRIGCIMCPFSTHQKQEAERWSKYADNYRRACRRAFDKAVADGVGRKNWKNGDDMYEWWIHGSKKYTEESQDLIPLFGDGDMF